MSVAGILASSLFSNAGSQIAQKAPGFASSIANGFKAQSGNVTGAPSSFAAVQQKLSGSGATSLPTQMSQLGQDLSSGNLTAAQADFNNIQMTLSQSPASLLRHKQTQPVSSGGSSPAGSANAQSGAGLSDPLTAALQAYSSLQQNPINGALSSSLMANPSTFSVNA
jgi:hypothetical protein